MSVSRRSFFAAIVGAVAAEVLPGKLREPALIDRFDELWEQLQEACHGPVWRPYWIWEWSEMSGSDGRLEILPPPLLPEFLIQKVGVGFHPDIPFATLHEILKTWGLTLSLNHRDVLASPFHCLGVNQLTEFVMPLRLKGDDRLKIELSGDGFMTERPVKVRTAFQGVVRIG